MIQQQIENFTRSLQDIATEYSDPSVILQHIPVLKDQLVLQQNPEFILYGLGGIVALFIVKKRIFKWRKNRVKDVAMVIPQPYEGEADHPMTSETAPASFDKDEMLQSDIAREIPEPTPLVIAEPATRTPTQQLEDVSAISFKARAALTPDEARMRVLGQAVLNEFGAGYMIMARTALSALLVP